MQNFGKYAIISNVSHTFEKEPTWYWNIKPPTSGDELNMSRFLVQARVEIGTDGVRREYPPTNTEVIHREIALTFYKTNIPKDESLPVEQGGEPLIPEGASVEAVEAVLLTMPHPLIMEIWGFIGDSVVGWGPAKSNVPNEKQTSAKSTKK